MKKTDIKIIIIVLIVALTFFIYSRVVMQNIEETSFVIITVDSEEYKRVSLNDPQTVIIDIDGKKNEVEITKEGVSMHYSSCENQLCLGQGEATLENLDTRIMGGWIVCLPNAVTIELVKGENHGE